MEGRGKAWGPVRFCLECDDPICPALTGSGAGGSGTTEIVGIMALCLALICWGTGESISYFQKRCQS